MAISLLTGGIGTGRGLLTAGLGVLDVAAPTPNALPLPYDARYTLDVPCAIAQPIVPISGYRLVAWVSVSRNIVMLSGFAIAGVEMASSNEFIEFVSIECGTDYAGAEPNMSYMTKGDTKPDYKANLYYAKRDSAGEITKEPIDLTGADIAIQYRHLGQDPPATWQESTASISGDPTNGNVVYEWQAGETDYVGEMEIRFKITFAGGGELTVPNNGAYEIIKFVENS